MTSEHRCSQRKKAARECVKNQLGVEPEKLLRRLAQAGIGPPEQFRAALEQPENRDRPPVEVLVEQGVPELEVCRLLAEDAGVELVESLEAALDPEVTALIPERLAKNHRVLPLSKENGTLVLGMADPIDVVAEDVVKLTTGLEVRRVMVPPKELSRAIKTAYSSDLSLADIVEKIPDSALEFLESPSEVIEKEALEALSHSAPIVQLVNTILADGIRMGASDIHVEPQQNALRVRYRIDGILRTIIHLPKKAQAATLSRLKLAANIDIAEHRIPQDGRVCVVIDGREVDLRVNTLPSYHGEKIVLRILDRHKQQLELTDLGFSQRELARLERALSTPQGMLVITGPTGSGKTSTLYAALRRLNQEKDNIVTVEDPVEYQLEGITQVPIRPKSGLTFSRALRAILRQDPDIVMVGEIRDAETAEIALQAAQTGHLVLSTLHTNDAASSVTRLLHMDIPGYLIGGSLLLAMAQRLVRRICSKCRTQTQPNPKTRGLLELMGRVELPDPVFAGKGCEHCNFSGYKGRMGLYEMLVVTDRIRSLILQNSSARAIEQAATEEGMTRMLDDGLSKVAQGLTTLEELVRVVAVEPKGTKTCPSCERPMDQDFLVCPYCTTGVSDFCPTCERGVESDWITCPYCKSALAEPQEQPPVLLSPAAPEADHPLPVGDEAVLLSEWGYEPPQRLVLLAMADRKLAASLQDLLSERSQLKSEVVTSLDEARRLAVGLRPRLIITDCSEIGPALIPRLKEQLITSLVPLLVISEPGQNGAMAAGLGLDADAFLVKPVEAGKLMSRVQQILS